MKTSTRTTVVLAVVALAAAALVVTAPPADPAGRPDWTVASCALWADTSSPVLPPYTLSDFCYNPDHTVIAIAPHVQIDCNNDSYNNGGDSPERTIPANLYKVLCK